MDANDQMRLICGWFSSWDERQRAIFLDKLVAKVTPDKLFALAQSIHLSNDEPKPTSPENCRSFEEQCKYFHRCFYNWSAEQSNSFLSELEAIDYAAICTFYDKVASTAGQV